MPPAAEAPSTRLSDGVGFATLRPTCAEASSQLVENMRATLRQAQERSQVEREIERLTALMHGGPAPPSAEHAERLPRLQSGAPTPLNKNARDRSRFDSNEGVPSRIPEGDHFAMHWPDAQDASAHASGHSGEAAGTPIAAQMTQQVETTVMWVQQLLESVHFVDSDQVLEPGASLLSIVQPRMRHQKEESLQRSLQAFSEKKEDEKEFDERAAFFRRQALQEALKARPRHHPEQAD
eukprot:TRINITY_DN25734_c0_g1_i2.p1 TRINITY_DN25734_c0_g1~~TRINITY_DN25734_c0_g1_i2.p1  ORF type:complete len:237 (-),score=57.46 TRINITY_DN25734_c0_g1_i2:120-830(-)